MWTLIYNATEMITKINDKITIWTKFNLAKLSMENISPPNILFNEEQISINDRWFDVLTPSQLVRIFIHTFKG